MAKGDILSMIVDLMNMDTKDQTLYVVITYDYFDGKPSGMSEVKPIWLDVDQCGFSEAKAKSQTGGYTVASLPWRSSMSGEILGMGGESTTINFRSHLSTIANGFLHKGHIHDGGVALKVKANGKLVCDSKATYGGTPAYTSGGDSMAGMTGMAGMAGMGGFGKGKTKGVSEHTHGGGKPHISKMSICVKGRPNLLLNQMRPGQTWTVEAQYDYRQYTGATHPNGLQENVMGIAILYVRK
jgi:hypothetical protein